MGVDTHLAYIAGTARIRAAAWPVAASRRTPHRHVELLGIGAGPSNLALAVALEELAPDALASGSLLLEQHESVAWQRGMLLPWAQSQVSFLKDLVTLRNPCSRYSFLAYLRDVGRLDDFVNMGSFTPYRMEISSYLRWVAESLQKVRVEYAQRCTAIEPQRDADGVLTGWLTHLADGSAPIASRYLAIGVGRDALIPRVFADLPTSRLIHSTQYAWRIGQLDKHRPHRIAIIGGAQSAAEMLFGVQQDLPACKATLVMRSVGLKAYETSKFTNVHYYPSFTDEFFHALPPAREQLLGEMHRSNYSGITPSLLESLYRHMYVERLTGSERMRMVTMADVSAARMRGDEVVLDLRDRKTGEVNELACDLVLLGTGFDREMPGLIRRLGDALGLDHIEVSRDYRLVVPGPATAACYLQGVNEATHGIADSLLSVLAHRSSEIAGDIVARHRALDQDARPQLRAAV